VQGALSTVSLEGAQTKRMLVFIFKSMAHAQHWCNSPDYSALRPHRQHSGETRNFVVEGFLDKLPD